MRKVESQTAKGTVVDYFEDRSKRWHWKIGRMGWIVGRSGPRGYSSKQGAQNSLNSLRRALEELESRRL